MGVNVAKVVGRKIPRAIRREARAMIGKAYYSGEGTYHTTVNKAHRDMIDTIRAILTEEPRLSVKEGKVILEGEGYPPALGTVYSYSIVVTKDY